MVFSGLIIPLYVTFQFSPVRSALQCAGFNVCAAQKIGFQVLFNHAIILRF